MPLRDRFRRLRKGSISADNSPPTAQTPETGSSTGEATPAMTRTPTIHSYDDLATIGDVLTHQATVKAEAEGKKKRGLFKWKRDPYKDWPTNVYKPHEVPPPKYRRTPDPKHIENLSAFTFRNNFDTALRRLSHQSGVSPGGSKWASRAGSRINSRAPSRLQSAAPSQDPSRNPSVAEAEEGMDDSGVGSPAREAKVKAGKLALNKGVSRPATKGKRDSTMGNIGEDDEGDAISRMQTAHEDSESRDAQKADSQSSNDMPFTQQELTQALSRASLHGNANKAVATPVS